jgi:eukaryotic-like serine/threonine-protein kinase
VAKAKAVRTDDTLVRPGRPLKGGARTVSQDLPGRLVLDRYRLVAPLGSGGFGTVWEALDERLGRSVAVKIISRAARSDPRARVNGGVPSANGRVMRSEGRALREAQAAARLSHPAIVGLYEAADAPEACYLVSELVRGETLDELERDGSLDDDAVLRVGVALCDALAHAHERGVVHRDVKPQNVIVPERPDGPAGVAKLTDFGVASIAGQDVLTRTGDVVGTLAYMAPEQASGRRVGPAADLYSLALVLYEALSGINPVRGRTPAETVRRLGSRRPSLARRRRDLPAALIACIDRALDLSPARRGDVEALREGLMAGRASLDVDAPRPWRPPSRGIARSRFVRPRPVRSRPAVVDDGDESTAPRAAPLTRRLRLLVAGAAGSLMAVGLAGLGPAPPVDPLLGGAGAALAVVVSPALGWLAGAIAIVAWLLSAGRGGQALMVGVAIATTAAGLRRWPWTWSIPALAPALGWLGLAGVFPALAGQASTLPRRALLGASGAVWLLLAESLSHTRLLVGPAGSSAPPGTWETSAGQVLNHVLLPLADSGLLAFAALWALAAAVLPYLVRGRSPLADCLGASVWAGALAWGTDRLERVLAAPVDPVVPRGLIASAIVSALVVVVARALSAGAGRDSRRG